MLIKSIKFRKYVENYVIGLLALVPATREITGKLRPSKEKNFKVYVKKPASLLNTYYFTSIFEWIFARSKQYLFAVYKDRQDKYNSFKI